MFRESQRNIFLRRKAKGTPKGPAVNKTDDEEPKKIKCFECQKEGHYIKNCPGKKKKRKEAYES